MLVWSVLVDISYCGFIVSCFFFKQKTAYEMRISDWSSDVCSSDLHPHAVVRGGGREHRPAALLAAFDFDTHRAQFPVIALRAILRVQIGRASCRERVCQYV